MSNRLPKDEALEKEDRIDEMQKYNQRPMGHNAHLNVQLWMLYSDFLDLIHMVVRGLLKEHYCKAFVKIPKVR